MVFQYWIEVFAIVYVTCCVHGQLDRKPRNDLTIDQIIMGTMLGREMSANLMAPMPNGNRLAELDMVLTPEQYETFYPSQTSSRKKRKAVRDTVRRWPEGVMPYQIKGRNAFSQQDIFMIKVAMREWEKYTCVRFQEKRPSDKDYVLFNDGFGCNSQLGVVGNGIQLLNLDRNGCRWKGLYLHEIGHALGLVHEHQRPIRDRFIEIISQNVEPSMLQWFDKYPSGAINAFNVDYEYSSVMHYGITAFSKDGTAQTIKARQPARESEIGRVYLKELSFTDIEVVNRMYDCNSHCDHEAKRCINGGFLDQNCECFCPDGTTNCEEGKIRRDNPACTNTEGDWRCNIWAKQGECDNNPTYMNNRCRKACGTCGDGEPESEQTVGQCTDLYGKNVCEKWKKNGDCIVNKRFMQRHCRETCGVCDGGSPPGGSCPNTHNDDSECEEWARKGECQINPGWMPFNCQKACYTCPDREPQTTAKPVTERPTRRPTTRRPRPTQKPVTERPTRRPTTRRPRPTQRPRQTSPTTTAIPRPDCENGYTDYWCNIWAENNHCTINPTFMDIYCMVSCNTCPRAERNTDTNTGNSGNKIDIEDNSCWNEYENSELCDIWAENEHCIINPSWMNLYCMKSCGTCSPALRNIIKRQAVEAGILSNDGTVLNATRPFGVSEDDSNDRNSAVTFRDTNLNLVIILALSFLGYFNIL